MSTAPFLFFLHIPKNAGTTLRSILDAQYGRRSVLTYYNQPNRQLLDNLRFMLLDRRADYRALVGHFSFGVHIDLGWPSIYITVMRDPVQRAISGYYENLKTDPGRLTLEDGTVLTLEQDIARRPQAYANQQLAMLTGTTDGLNATEADLDLARKNLERHFAFVGTQERFDESILMISKALGWQPCLYGRMNPGRSHLEIDQSTLDELARLNQLDRMLYDEVSRKLDERIAAEPDLFGAAYAELAAALSQHPTSITRIEPTTMPNVSAFLNGPIAA